MKLRTGDFIIRYFQYSFFFFSCNTLFFSFYYYDPSCFRFAALDGGRCLVNIVWYYVRSGVFNQRLDLNPIIRVDLQKLDKNGKEILL